MWPVVQQQLRLLGGGGAATGVGAAGTAAVGRRASTRPTRPSHHWTSSHGLGWGHARLVVSARAPATRQARHASTAPQSQAEPPYDDPQEDRKDEPGTYSEAKNEHAVISTFDLFSIGIGPSSSHTVGPMRAGNIFVADLVEAGLLRKVHRIRVAIYGSLALTGEGHMTPSALLLGLESADVETVDTSYVPARFDEIKREKRLVLGNGLPPGQPREIVFDYERDFKWEWSKKLPLHSNGMRISVFDEEGMPLATNDLFSIGGGFVVNGALSTAATAAAAAPPTSTTAPPASSSSSSSPNLPESSGGHPADMTENIFYKEIRRSDATGDRRTGAGIKPTKEAKQAKQTKEATEVRESRNAKQAKQEAGGPSPRLQSSTVPAEKPASSMISPTSAQQPRYPFHDATSLLALCNKHNLTIAQLVYENEKSMGYSDDNIRHKLFRIWEVMDSSILEGVQAPLDTRLPGSLELYRRAPALYRRLTRGLYPAQTFGTMPGLPLSSRDHQDVPLSSAGPTPTPTPTARPKQSVFGKRAPPRVHGNCLHPVQPSPLRRTTFAEMDHLSVYAMAVNETNAAGGRIVTAPTNGAAGIIPAVLKYTVEFLSDDPERDVLTFLLTAAAIGMLYKRGATISAAEGGCMAEVGVACSMAAGAFAACMGASPETIEQAAEIGIEHNLGLTCDPIAGLVQAPCIERNALGAVKAISSANLALNSDAVKKKVGLDDAIRAMRVTAQGMRNEFKETSLSGLATSVPFNIPVSVPAC